SLAADPKEPEFFATYLWQRSSRLSSRLGSVGFGQTIGILRARDWQLSIAAGVFSQFDLSSTTADLMNTDYLVGLPVAYRRGNTAMRLRVYHQSSHLGDEYMIHAHAQRVDLSFEAAELLVARELADPLLLPGSGWRWSVQLKGYSGPSPYGEFFRDRVSSLGFGLGLAL